MLMIHFIAANRLSSISSTPCESYSFCCRYGTVMGGLLSEKFLDTNLSIPFAGPPLNTPSLQKYKRVWSLEHFDADKLISDCIRM